MKLKQKQKIEFQLVCQTVRTEKKETRKGSCHIWPILVEIIDMMFV